ncbi:hypothetical protein [Pseudomonas abietaniphila]|uniref:Uncharacterized protein n=1 Tax=Pseudomonas abietaniphila TaxID=89065 RepID=A0A1G8LLP1_9PSED|nr:hypothetical protein [Pseudomonas abietaniphila]SDI56594.1 hypothetical protein SAMN05216605_114184 [Pseudomonas abietaniphila]
MTRDEHQEIHTVATAALVGILSSDPQVRPELAAKTAFDAAESFAAERKKRIGEEPHFDM